MAICPSLPKRRRIRPLAGTDDEVAPSDDAESSCGRAFPPDRTTACNVVPGCWVYGESSQKYEILETVVGWYRDNLRLSSPRSLPGQ